MTTTPTIFIRSDEELAVLLGTLGDTEQAVAKTLVAKNIKGRVGLTEHCPIANWLRAETGCEHVEVDVGDVYLRYNRPGLFGNGFIAHPSGAVDDFIDQFDSGMHPDLIEDGATP